MLSPKDIKKKAESKYTAFLRTEVTDARFFPLEIPGNKRPNANLAVFKDEITQLLAHSTRERDYGYTVELKERETKRHGRQSLPTRIAFETRLDYLKFLKKEREVARFRKNIAAISQEFPELDVWLFKFPRKVVYYADLWPDILKVCRYFRQNPKPNLYIRELPIMVHTKFIQRNQPIITELLNIIIAPHLQNVSNFQARFNLKDRENLVRFRILDDDLLPHYHGLSDISVPVSHFSRIDLPIKRVIVVENEYTFLSLPKMKATLGIFGSGFKVAGIQSATWLKEVDLVYWGDLDIHGFQILSQVRTYFPQTRSVMMNEGTFKEFYENDKGRPSNVKNRLRLTAEEERVYVMLREGDFRLEQEKLPHWYVVERLGEACGFW